MMTRKDYIAIAAIIRATKENYSQHSAPLQSAIVEIQNGIGDYFESDNPAFDRARFDLACAESR